MALFAWTVVYTRCPVSADCTAISAVSGSRISPTMMRSRSWRRIERSPRAAEPFLLVDGDLEHASQVILDRVLDGDDLVLAIVHFRDHGIEGRGLAASGRAGHEQHPVGLGGSSRKRDLRVSSNPSESRVNPCSWSDSVLRSRILQHRVLAVDAGHHRDAKVDLAACLCSIAVACLEAAVLRHAALRDVQLGHHLDARNDLLGELVPARFRRRSARRRCGT